MTPQKTIEFVCTANRGRSPVAALTGSNYLRDIRADDYRTISSGSHVDAIRNGELSTAFMIQIIDRAKNRKMYSPIGLDSIDEAIRDGNNDALKYFYQQAVDVFQAEEHKYRSEVLPMFGIEGKVKETQTQIVARPDVLGVFVMSEINNQKVQEIYNRSNYCPKVIEVLGVLDSFGLDRKAYELCIEKIVDYVPKAIEGLLSEV